MKKSLFALLVTIAVFLSTRSPARADVSFDFFYDSLSPYGSWVEIGDYGYCWHPRGMDEDWAPYTDGYWAYTDAGWTWVSYEDFGAITYHYGRWVDVDDEGWCWVPGEEWAPAWVSWRSSDDYIGWAPLPPRAVFTASIGFSTWVDREYDIGPRYYNFCEVRHFGAPALRPLIIDRNRNVTVINNTVNITNITVRGDRHTVYNGGPRFDVVSRRSDRPIQTLRLVQRTEFDPSDRRPDRLLARQQGNQLIVAAPIIRKSDEHKFKPQNVARVIQTPSIDTGWNRIKDPKIKGDLRTKLNAQASGKPQDAPAKAVSAEEVKVVDERIKAQPAVATVPEQIVGGKHGKEPKGNEVTGDRVVDPGTIGRTEGTVGKSGKDAHREKQLPGVDSPVSPPVTIEQQPGTGTPPEKVVRKNGKVISETAPPPANTVINPPSEKAVKSNENAASGELQPFTSPPDQNATQGKGRKNQVTTLPSDAEAAARQNELKKQAGEERRRELEAARAARQQQKIRVQEQPASLPPAEPIAPRGKERKDAVVTAPIDDSGQRAVEQQRRNAMRENALQQQQEREAIHQQQQQKIRSQVEEQPRVRERAVVPQERVQQPPQIQQQVVPSGATVPSNKKQKGNDKKDQEKQDKPEDQR